MFASIWSVATNGFDTAANERSNVSIPKRAKCRPRKKSFSVMYSFNCMFLVNMLALFLMFIFVISQISQRKSNTI